MPELEKVTATDFGALLKGSISRGMEKILGPDGARAILYHLDLPNLNDPKAFHEKLSAIFGEGTESLERVILQDLHQTMGIRRSSTRMDFVSQVERARRQFAIGKMYRGH